MAIRKNLRNRQRYSLWMSALRNKPFVEHAGASSGSSNSITRRISKVDDLGARDTSCPPYT
jgi:hypothetical protein